MAVRDQDVFIVGGGNSAGQAAVYLADFARSVTILVRKKKNLKTHMSQYLIDQLQDTPNVHIRTGVTLTEAKGEERLEALTIHDPATGQKEVLPAYALFVFIGASTRTEWLEGTVERDRQGYILTGPAVMKDGKRPNRWTEKRDPFLECGGPALSF